MVVALVAVVMGCERCPVSSTAVAALGWDGGMVLRMSCCCGSGYGACWYEWCSSGWRWAASTATAPALKAPEDEAAPDDTARELVFCRTTARGTYAGCVGIALGMCCSDSLNSGDAGGLWTVVGDAVSGLCMLLSNGGDLWSMV